MFIASVITLSIALFMSVVALYHFISFAIRGVRGKAAEMHIPTTVLFAAAWAMFFCFQHLAH